MCLIDDWYDDEFYYDEYEKITNYEHCQNCGRLFDDIDYDYQICSYCNYDSYSGKFVVEWIY